MKLTKNRLHFRTRGLATGLTVSLSYLFSFISIKTYFKMETLLSIGGTFVLYGSVSVLG